MDCLIFIFNIWNMVFVILVHWDVFTKKFLTTLFYMSKRKCVKCILYMFKVPILSTQKMYIPKKYSYYILYHISTQYTMTNHLLFTETFYHSKIHTNKILYTINHIKSKNMKRSYASIIKYHNKLSKPWIC